MAEASISLLIKASNQASPELQKVNADIKAQQQAIKQLQAAETARAAAQRAALAQSKLVAAQDAQASNASLKNQKALEQAQQAAARATAQSEIASRKHALTLAQTGTEATKTGTALQQMGTVGSSAGAMATAGLGKLLTVLTSIATTALSVGAGLAAIGTAGLASGLKGAADAEMAAVLAKNNIAGAMGGDRVAAGDFVKKQNAAILTGSQGGLIDTGLSKKMAQVFADDVVKAFGTGQDSANLVAGMSNRLSGLVDFGGVDKGMMTNALTDFFSGSMTEDMLQGRDAFIDANLVKPLQDEISKSGKALKDLDPGERIQVMDKALKRALTSDGLQEMAGTARGQIKILNNRLFGEQGMFSVMRDLFPEVEGEQNVFEQFKNTLGLLFNSDGLFAQLGRILQASGIDFDIMQSLRDNWLKFNTFLQGVNEFLLGIEDVSELKKLFDPQKLGRSITDGLVGLFDGIANFLKTIDFRSAAAGLGNAVNAFLSGTDFAAMGQAFGRMLGTALTSAAGATVGLAASINWGTILQKAYNLVQGAILGSLQSIVGAGFQLGASILPLISAPVLQFFGNLDSYLLTTLTGIASQIITTTSQTWNQIVQTVSTAGQQVLTAITTAWATIQTVVSTAMASVQSAISTAWATIQSTIQTGMATVQSAIQSAISTIQSTVTTIWTAIQSFISEKFQSLQSNVSSIINSIVTAVTNAWNALSDKVQSFASSISGLADIGSGIVDAWNSLVSKANSFASLISGLSLPSIGGGGGGGGGASFQPVSRTLPPTDTAFRSQSIQTSYTGGNIQVIVQPSPGMNELQLADMVIRRINEKVKQERLAYG